MVSELEGQVKVWKDEAESLSVLVAKGQKEHATWLGRTAELQQRLEEQATESGRLKQKAKDLEEKCSQEESMRRTAEREKVETRAALASALNEKSVLDGAVESIKEDFERVRKSFEILKSRLAQKEKRLAELEANCQARKECDPEVRRGGEKLGESFEESSDVLEKGETTEDTLEKGETTEDTLEKGETTEDTLLEWESWSPGSRSGEEQIGKQAAARGNKFAKNLNEGTNKSDLGAFVRPLPESQPSVLGASPCCLAAMERVDLEWREKHKTSVHALMRKMNQKLRQSREMERGKDNFEEPPTKIPKLPLSKPIMSFSLLPAPSKFNDTAILELLGESQNVIRKNNSSMATLKSSLMSLSEEVSSLENQIKFTFLSGQKCRSVKSAD